MSPPAPPLLRSRLLGELPWLRHGFGTRACGLRQPRPGGPRARADSPLVTLRQVHSDLIWLDPAPGAAGDGLLTRQPGRWPTLRTADCCPILLVDARRRAVAAVHAGWRGTVAGIAEKAVGEMRAAWGSRPQDVRAALGPSIRGCCYEVGAEVQRAFRARFDYADELFLEAEEDPLRTRYPMLFLTGAPPGHPYDPRWNRETPLRLDLAAANRRQLLQAGLPSDAIEVLPYCTACHPELFYSHRRGDVGRMLSGIGIAKKKA